MSRPNKEELQQQLTEARLQVDKLHDELKKYEKTKQSYEQGFEVGTQIQAMKNGLMDAGLSEETAMSIIYAGISACKL